MLFSLLSAVVVFFSVSRLWLSLLLVACVIGLLLLASVISLLIVVTCYQRLLEIEQLMYQI